MAPKERRETGGEESLVPLIEDEERRLALMVEAARTRAQEIVQEAKNAADERLEAARRRLPSLREGRRREAAELFASEAAALRRASSEALVELREAAASGREAAVSKIVESVWPVRRQAGRTAPVE